MISLSWLRHLRRLFCEWTEHRWEPHDGPVIPLIVLCLRCGERKHLVKA